MRLKQQRGAVAGTILQLQADRVEVDAALLVAAARLAAARDGVPDYTF